MIGAFLIGLFGSLHCLGMCGPLVMTFTRTSGKEAFRSFVVYHGGRLAVYASIGVLFGLLSHSMFFFEVQKAGAIIIGLAIVLIYGVPGIRSRVEGWYYRSAFYYGVKSRLVTFYGTKVRWFAAGVLNGLLPCGVVYLAAAGAILAGSIGSAVQFMVVFGLGTLPMFGVLVLLKAHSPRVSRKLANLTTPIALFAGILLILRGVLIDNPDVNELIRVQMGKFITICGF